MKRFLLFIFGLLQARYAVGNEGYCRIDNKDCSEPYIRAYGLANEKFKDDDVSCAKNCCFTSLIRKDLEPFTSITKEDLDSARNVVGNAVTYRIVSGKLYRSASCLFPSRCKGIEYFLHCVKKDLRYDIEFVVNTHDWPHAHKHFYEGGKRVPPIFSFSKTSYYLDITFPAWTFKEGGPAISLYPNGLGQWDEMREKIITNDIPWDLKENKVFFRGSRTSNERDNLILLSRRRTDLLDALYTKNQAWKSMEDTLNVPPAKEVPLEDHCKYKYLFNFRGVAASFRFKHLFLCKSLVFHVGDEWTEFFYHSLVPWVHYIPVSSSASQEEILKLINFAEENPSIAKSIAKQGYDLIKERLTNAQVKCYWRELLNAYGELMEFDSSKNLSSFVHLK